jgi:crossover junction endodeoxyribonuclease RuvC
MTPLRVVGLDLSLTGTGVARVTRGQHHQSDDDLDIQLRLLGSVTAGKDVARRSARLRTLAHNICTHCAGANLVAVEEPAYSKTMGQMHDRSGLWWLVVARLTANGIPVAEVPSTVLKMYALGKGGGADTGKDAVLATVVRRYPAADVTSNNTADALVIAAMAARHSGCPIEAELPQTHLRAMDKVSWPT